MRIAPVPKVAGGTTMGALAGYGVASLQEYGVDIRPVTAAFLVLVVNFVVSWLIPDGEDGPPPNVPLYPAETFPDPDDPPAIAHRSAA